MRNYVCSVLSGLFTGLAAAGIAAQVFPELLPYNGQLILGAFVGLGVCFGLLAITNRK